MDIIIETNTVDHPFSVKQLEIHVGERAGRDSWKKEGIIDFFMLCNKNNVVQP